MADMVCAVLWPQRGNQDHRCELSRQDCILVCRMSCGGSIEKTKWDCLSRCQTSMREIMRIAPLQNEPGLIAYECPACKKLTSEILAAGPTTGQSDAS